MKVVLYPGQTLIIEFADDKGKEVDGQFTVDYDNPQFPGQLVIRETAGLSGSIIGEANEILYQEKFDDWPELPGVGKPIQAG